MLLVALAIFALGSLACAAAQSFPQLIAARVLQGLGGGGLMTLSQATIGELVPPLERVRYQGYFALVFMTASIGGPIVGGFVVAHTSWRWLFLANLPLATVAAWRLCKLPAGERHPRAGSDYIGLVLFALGASVTLFWLTSGGHRFAWLSGASGALFVVAAACIVGLYLHEHRTPTPFLPMDLFADRAMRQSVLLVAQFAATLFALIFFLPIYLQLGHGVGAALSGVLLLPLTSGQIVASLIAARVVRRMADPQRIPEFGMAFAAVALLLLGVLPAHIGWVIALGFATGLGLGCVMAINQVVVQTIAGHERLGAATSMNSLARSTGGASGAALFGALIFAQIPGVDSRTLLENSGTTRVETIVHAFHNGFLAAALVAALGAYTARRMPRIKLWETQPAAPGSK
jgi:MFS family permease